MTRLVLLRHGPTQWNADRRLQGRADLPLLGSAIAELRGRRLPDAFRGRLWLTSPLRRAYETAAALGIVAEAEPTLTEMHWGDYEGRTLTELRNSLGRVLAENETRGVDFQPPAGESPRQVMERLRPLLVRIAGTGRDFGAVTHKGVIRAMLSMACDWPMLGKPPVKLDWRCLHDFRITDDGRPELLAANIPLE